MSNLMVPDERLIADSRARYKTRAQEFKNRRQKTGQQQKRYFLDLN